MKFHEVRRQQFLTEKNYNEFLKVLDRSIPFFATHPTGSGVNDLHRQALGRLNSADGLFARLCLHYTAGLPIDPLRAELGDVIGAYERHARYLREYEGDRNVPVFVFNSLDDYSRLMQLIGLCYLLNRRDLLPRIASMQDGEDRDNGGTDTLFEEFMAYAVGAENRFESDYLCWPRPYEALFHALTETTPQAALKELNGFLKRWYKDHAGTGWHDSHKGPEGGGYHGYWSFEAGAAALLMGIEDDSSLHQYLYYPKDMVAFARGSKVTADSVGSMPEGRCAAGQPCPRDGWWFSPAKVGSRRYFKQGEVMPKLDTGYGDTFWQWDTDQSEPKL